MVKLFQIFVFSIACSCIRDVTSPPLTAIDVNFMSGLGSMRECFPLCLPTSSAGFWMAIRRLRGQHQQSHLSSGSSPLKYPHLLHGCNSQTCRTFPVPVMFPSASRLRAHMVEASVTSAVNMTLFGHTEDSEALEIEPFFPPPTEKESFFNRTEFAL